MTTRGRFNICDRLTRSYKLKNRQEQEESDYKKWFDKEWIVKYFGTININKRQAQ